MLIQRHTVFILTVTLSASDTVSCLYTGNLCSLSIELSLHFFLNCSSNEHTLCTLSLNLQIASCAAILQYSQRCSALYVLVILSAVVSAAAYMYIEESSWHTYQSDPGPHYSEGSHMCEQRSVRSAQPLVNWQSTVTFMTSKCESIRLEHLLKSFGLIRCQTADINFCVIHVIIYTH